MCAFCSSGRSSGYNFTTVTPRTSGSVLALLKGLKKFRKYGVVIQAFNEKGPGPMAAELITQTLEDGKLLLSCNTYHSYNLFKLKREFPRQKRGQIKILEKTRFK